MSNINFVRSVIGHYLNSCGMAIFHKGRVNIEVFSKFREIQFWIALSAVGIASCRCGSMVLTLLCQTDVNITSLQMSKRQSLFNGLFCYPASTGLVPTRSRQPMATPPSEPRSNSLHCRRPCQLAKPRMLLNPRPRGIINWKCPTEQNFTKTRTTS